MSSELRVLLDQRGVHRATGELWVPAYRADVVWWVGDHAGDEGPLEAAAGVPVIRLSPSDLVGVAAEPQAESRVLVVARAAGLLQAIDLGFWSPRATLVVDDDAESLDALVALGVELLEQRLPNVTPRRRTRTAPVESGSPVG